jgi:hypothetical protein
MIHHLYPVAKRADAKGPAQKPHLGHRFGLERAAAVALTCLSALASMAQEPGAADIVAAQIRTQGYACSPPVAATREASRPNQTVWVLSCGNARYRVLLVPDLAAHVTRLD